MQKKQYILPSILFLLLTASSCVVKKPAKRAGFKYATRSQLEDCLGKQRKNKPQIFYHEITEGETVFKLSRIYNTTVENILSINSIDDINDIAIGTVLAIESRSRLNEFAWPLRGIITSGYGRRGRGFHHGIDIAAKKGTAIRSSADGVVVLSGNNIDGFGGYGKIIALQHSNDMFSVYAHNSKNSVEEGECIRQGSKIAEVGATGNATGPHLHFEIRKDRTPLNPNIYLK